MLHIMKDKKKLYGLLYAAEANLIVCFLQMYPIIRFCKMLFKKKHLCEAKHADSQLNENITLL